MYKDKVVVITGGSQGIGQHLALAYLEQQAKVIVLDIAPNKSPGMDFYLVDLGRPEQIEQAFDEIQRKYGKVDVLINNGAIANFNKPIQQLTFEEFSRVIDVNLKGAFACSRRFIALNHAQPYGRIINIASTRWNQNESGWDAYGASKGGVVSMTQSMAISLSDTPITVNAVSPGWIQVEGYGELDNFDHQQHPSGRVGKAKDIVNACLFLTHPENDFVNGHNLVVDGGMSKKMIYQDSFLD
ncbi:short-chain dehydrogenase [Vibrio sp. 10N.222.52.B12]|uniref:SDR family NAD(P)-dependent oxidoreductase n=1 Tax=Vibrio sp. 10N.222.52.B12 TaxID=1880840 RepID=UPI0005AF06CA|nr:SDR family oxidoreductase [Vibrio sp. 10N.222.52.B12]KIP67917.1 short-chain dehydrogenase [Vibrio harveyi]PMO43738.1 short-chain dehydrogenase [Vibrio sp. 10N.222.52.B12]